MSARTGAAGRFASEAGASPGHHAAAGADLSRAKLLDDGADDILTRPLGVAQPVVKRRLPSIRVSGPIVACVGVATLVLASGTLLLLGDRHGGQPRAVAQIVVREAPPAPRVAAAPVPEAPPQRLQRSAQEVEQASGVNVTRPAGAAPDVAVIIGVPSTEPTGLAKAPDSRLVERTRHGQIPRLGESRTRALDVYARPDNPEASGPRIAILVSGVGVGDAATAAAITRLPPEVSLGISPYGQEVDKTAARARLAGHEVFLQVPMEPFDYPDSDPGPQTLLTTSRAPENLDRLTWAMSRFPGFVGIVNFMGGKLVGDAAAFEPILREIGTRGLGYVDDGTTQRSLAASLGAKLKTPNARAEIVLDATPRPEAIDKELARLEAQARSKGFALASASAMPMSVDRIARWSRDLESRGVHLVPVSIALRGSGPAARLSSASR